MSDGAKVGQDLRQKLAEYATKQDEMRKTYEGGCSELNDDLASERPNLARAAERFEKTWNAVKEQVNELDSEFDRIKSKSSEYFGVLKRNTAEINDDTRRKSEYAANDEVSKAWDEIVVAMEKTMAVLRARLKDGDDLIRQLVNADLRGRIKENIEQVKKLIAASDELFAKLGELTKKGKQLLAPSVEG